MRRQLLGGLQHQGAQRRAHLHGRVLQRLGRGLLDAGHRRGVRRRHRELRDGARVQPRHEARDAVPEGREPGGRRAVRHHGPDGLQPGRAEQAARAALPAGRGAGPGGDPGGRGVLGPRLGPQARRRRPRRRGRRLRLGPRGGLHGQEDLERDQGRRAAGGVHHGPDAVDLRVGGEHGPARHAHRRQPHRPGLCRRVRQPRRRRDDDRAGPRVRHPHPHAAPDLRAPTRAAVRRAARAAGD